MDKKSIISPSEYRRRDKNPGKAPIIAVISISTTLLAMSLWLLLIMFRTHTEADTSYFLSSATDYVLLAIMFFSGSIFVIAISISAGGKVKNLKNCSPDDWDPPVIH